jgi:transposase
MTKDKQLSFEGQSLYVGLDAHKTNWKIHLRMGNIELKGFSQNPDAALLAEHMRRLYPGASIKVAYEAGFCGFTIQRALDQVGIECIVVNPADVPTTDKERKRKDDQRDARKLSRELAEGSLKAIYVPAADMEHARTVVRWRHRLVKDQTRCKNRIKHLLLFSGLEVQGTGRWSLKYVHALQQIPCASPTLKVALDLAIQQYLSIRQLLSKATLEVRKLARQEPFLTLQPYLQSIDGVGLINGMVIQTELQDMSRFKTLDRLCDYCGLVPDMSSSDERRVVKGITHRGNELLREALVESAWVSLQSDPAMLLKYQEYRRRMNAGKAIIRIAKHLLARIRYVWSHQVLYQRGIGVGTA